MRVLIGCEHTGAVRRAFRDRGHNAYSVDLLPAIDDSPYHITGDIFDVLAEGSGREWDLAIFHPPCTYLANSGVRWLYNADKTPNGDRWAAMRDGAYFFYNLLHCKVKRVAVENPVQHKWARHIIGEGPTQTIQPWQFGHTESKRTGLWLRNLPKLVPTKDVYAEMMQLPIRERQKVWYASPGKDRWQKRSATYQGIADAMAEQWGVL